MPTRELTVNTTRFDPYKNFKFRIKWDKVYVAGFSQVSGMSRTTQVIKQRPGGDPSTARMSPGQTEYRRAAAGVRQQACGWRGWRWR
jgi:phage tail-like protein